MLEQPRLRAGLTAAARSGEVRLFGARSDQFLTIDDATGFWAALLDVCDGTRDARALETAVGATHGAQGASQTSEAVAQLETAGFLVDAADDRPDAFADQRAYLESIARPADDVAAMEAAVRSTHALVVGAGGVGSWVGLALAMAGVSRITVVDPDRVELRNLTRQPFPVAAVGQRKIEALGALVRERRPDIGYSGIDLYLEDPRDLRAMLDGVHVVVGCADGPTMSAAALLIARACTPRRVPHLIASYQGATVRIGPTWVPGSACSGCLELSRQRDDGANGPTEAEVARTRSRARATPVTAAQAMLAASLAVSEILHLRAGLHPASADHVIAVDLERLARTRSRLRRDPACSICGVIPRDRAVPTSASRRREGVIFS